MSAKLKCPKCRTAILPGTTTCKCGWKESNNPVETRSMACIFTTEGRRCRMVGTKQLLGDRGMFCSWHHYCLNSKDKAGDKEAFIKFAKKRGALSLTEIKQKDSNIPVVNHQWREDPEVLWKKVMAFN